MIWAEEKAGGGGGRRRVEEGEGFARKDVQSG